jgi:hypothetical protein
MRLRKHTPRPTGPPAIPGAQPELCDVCAAVVTDGTELHAMLADSSAVDPRRPVLDGWRRVVACGPDHLAELVDHYRGRPFDDDELCAYVVARAGRRAPWELDLAGVAESSGLTLDQVRRGVRWQSIWHSWLPLPEDGG